MVQGGQADRVCAGRGAQRTLCVCAPLRSGARARRQCVGVTGTEHTSRVCARVHRCARGHDDARACALDRLKAAVGRGAARRRWIRRGASVGARRRVAVRGGYQAHVGEHDNVIVLSHNNILKFKQ